MPDEILAHAVRSLWTTVEAGARCRTLARLAQHERQLEAWWKWELAAHLWDHVERLGPTMQVWVESHDRADITLGAPETSGSVRLASEGSCIPIELKTTGTWWGTSRSQIEKALNEENKRLGQDMRELHDAPRRADPFGLVGLLVTHVGRSSDEVFERYLERARELGQEHRLEVLVDDAIALPMEALQPVAAHQLFWLARSPGIGARRRSSSPSAVHRAITARQVDWAVARKLSTDARGWAKSVEDNLFEPLDPEARREIESGDGNELAGKLCAPWSSSALAVNFFHYWRRRANDSLAAALGRSSITKMQFERCHPTGNRQARANLDVEITTDGAVPLAIESKFREPFGPHEPLAPSYLTKPELWRTLPRCYELAHRIVREPRTFERLDVAQLLKHILGLTRSYGAEFELLYLWYDPTSIVDAEDVGAIAQHRREVDQLAATVGDEVRLTSLTYQELFASLRVDGEYGPYMMDRYFGAVDATAIR